MTTRKTQKPSNQAMIQSGLARMEIVLGKSHPLVESVRKVNDRINTLESRILHAQMETQIALQERKRLIHESAADKARDDRAMEKEVAKPLTLGEKTKRRLWASAIYDKKDETFDMARFTTSISEVRKIDFKATKGSVYHVILNDGTNYLLGEGNLIETFCNKRKIMSRLDAGAAVRMQIPTEEGKMGYGWLAPIR